MPDYAQLAIDAKAKEKAAELQATARQKLDSDVREYFAQLHVALSAEMEKANEELRRQDVATFSGIVVSEGEAVAGESAGRSAGSALGIQYGENRYSKVELRMDPPELDVLMTGTVDDGPASDGTDSNVHRTWFFQSREGGLLVNRTNYIPGVDRSPTLEEIAETIVAGMIRGRFD